jgi:hypothetical protein
MLVASTQDSEVEALGGLASLESQGWSHAPHPVVGRAVRLFVEFVLDGGMLYWSSPPGGFVLFAQRCTGMASVLRWLSLQPWWSEWSVPVPIRGCILDHVLSPCPSLGVEAKERSCAAT